MARRLRDPLVWTSASQLAKTVLAAVIAWVLAVHVLHVTQAFLAPWAALLTVQATVFGTLKRGMHQAAASFVGVLLAFAAGSALGVSAASVGLVVFAGLLVGSVRGLRLEATTAASTALVVLASGYSSDSGMLLARLADTGVGVAVGLLVNLIVWPPLRDRSAARRIDEIDDRIGELLTEMARDLRRGHVRGDDWIARTNDLDGDVDEAWQELGRARESARLNPRRAVPQRMRAAGRFAAILGRLEQAVAETRSMATTIELTAEWDERFRGPWLDLLERAGAAIADADVSALSAVREELDALAGELGSAGLDAFWPVAGALLVNLRNTLEALGAVAGEQPVRVASPAVIGS
jgi:uncharacterized membrane protein YgaE (UPF0421/DUF939 family)